MGFGILFLGYFLILDFAYYSYTDAIAAVLMTYALYKLSTVNGNFKKASVAAGIFTLFGIYELVITFGSMMLRWGDLTTLLSVSAMVRHLIICLTSALMLLGMRDVCAEVGIENHAKKCGRLSYAVFAVYGLNVLMEAGDFSRIIPTQAIAVISIFVLIATLALVCVNLHSIYICYMKICMPEENDKVEETDKKSRFGFVNAFREHEAQKQKEYAEYKLGKLKKKTEKNKGIKQKDEK